jgi:acetylornithine deacetylase/succinyl-diaminopimelate desuccinylase-like protein
MLRSSFLATVLSGFVLTATLPLTAAAQVPRPSPADSVLAQEIFTELIRIRSVSGAPGTLEAAHALVRRLREAGFSEQDAFVTGPTPEVGNVVARLRGRGTSAPILVMAHLDVVDALREDWTTDPFVLTEVDGWWHGRGTIDNKEAATHIIANFIRWKRAGLIPERDIVAMITGDEETSGASALWLSSGDGRRLIGDPAFALNFDAGSGTSYGGRETRINVQTSEKIYVSYHLTVRNAGGHSSLPRRDNAIYALARALSRIEAHRFPVELNETTRLFLERTAAFEPDSLAVLMRAVAREPMDEAATARLSEIPRFNALLRTTCIATRLAAGHADNALPQTAQATVNCRLLPGTDTAVIARTLRDAVADAELAITEVAAAKPSPPSPLTEEIVGAVERVTARFWPGVVLVPVMSTGATDGLYVRNAGIPVYGVSGVFFEPDESRAHGRDERIEIRRFYEGLEFGKRIVEELAR